MEVSNPRDDRAEQNRGSAEVPVSTVIPRVGNFHLEKNTILDSFSCTTTPQIWFISRFCVIFFGALSLGENTWVRCNFITQAKSVAISVWCARIILATQTFKPKLLPNFLGDRRNFSLNFMFTNPIFMISIFSFC